MVSHLYKLMGMNLGWVEETKARRAQGAIVGILSLR